MKRWMVLMAAAAMAVAPCYGQETEASRRAKVEELMTTMHVDSMMDQMTAMAKSQVERATKGLPGVDTMTPEQKKIFEAYQSRSMDVVMQSVSWKAIEPEVVKLYTDTFTEQEIDGIVAFYKSPVGQALLNKTPQLMAGMMQFMQGRIAELQPKLKILTDQFTKDMAAAGGPAAKS